jgi:hypothetical protein
MPITGLFGPHDLTERVIDEIATSKSIGNYACGYVNDASVFIVSYTGRSDSDLNGRLKQHVGKYKKFKYGYMQTAKDAFEKECSIYHDFSPPDNQVHPARPANTSLTCPRCRILG